MTGASRHLLGIALLAIALALPAAQKTSKQIEQDIKKAEQQKKELVQRLERVRKEAERNAANVSKQQRELRAAEKSAASARSSLRELQQQRSERAAARKKLQDQRAAREVERKGHQDELANQLRGAYYMGRNEPLQLLLNQRSSAQMSRILTYYGYFGRLRANQIEKLNQDVAEIEELSAQIEAEDAELAALEERQKKQVGELEAARQQRGKALAAVEKEARDSNNQKSRLQKERQQLDKQLDVLIQQLANATKSTPFDPNAPFAKVRGQLSWPVAGQIDVDYGVLIGGEDHRSDAIEINARQGAEVRAIAEGRVEFADYQGGRGNFVILNHGDGFYSLYGHNEQLFRQQGDHVKAGDLIATAGDSGGRKTPGLYFQIRSVVKGTDRTKAVNPHEWFRSRVPPAR